MSTATMIKVLWFIIIFNISIHIIYITTGVEVSAIETIINIIGLCLWTRLMFILKHEKKGTIKMEQQKPQTIASALNNLFEVILDRVTEKTIKIIVDIMFISFFVFFLFAVVGIAKVTL